MMRLFAQIEKVAKREDGTVDVFGFASSEAIDSDGEIITADAMRNALPDYMKFANVREMHDATKAAGTATDATVQDDGKTYFAVHVVDPVAVLKVESGVYKGFSIAGRVLERQGNKITQLTLVEVSLVDRPANPDAVFTCYKMDTAMQKTMAPTDAAPPATVAMPTGLSQPTCHTLKAAQVACQAANQALADLLDANDEPHRHPVDTAVEMQKVLNHAHEKIQALQETIAAQAQTISAWESSPAVAKGALKVIDKSEDTAPMTNKVATNPREAILSAHRIGGFRFI